jgi:hypothetical protein
MSCHQGTGGKRNIANKTLGQVTKFKYLGIKVPNLITFAKKRADLIRGTLAAVQFRLIFISVGYLKAYMLKHKKL